MTYAHLLQTAVLWFHETCTAYPWILLLLGLLFSQLAAASRAVQHTVDKKYKLTIFPNCPEWIEKFMSDKASRYLIFDGSHLFAALNDIFNRYSGIFIGMWHVYALIEPWWIALYWASMFVDYYFSFNLFNHRILVVKNERSVWHCIPIVDLVQMWRDARGVK